ncbi:MAG: hypothetical protein IJ374_10220 [Lachnospiraceae bacterium]|nr:hypothetical protein [Lachnospiraceae bacterium]
MILDKMFSGGTPYNFESRCKKRIVVGVVVIILGMIALVASINYDAIPKVFLDAPKHIEFIKGFYTGSGSGLMVAGMVIIIKNIRFLKNEELKKKRAVEEGDERNRLIGTKCWAYAGYSLFLCLYIGIMVSGFISVLVLKVLLGVLGVYGGLLLIFRLLLQKSM